MVYPRVVIIIRGGSKVKTNRRLGAISSLTGALLGIVGSILIFQKRYESLKVGPYPEEGCATILEYVMPFLSDLCLLGGVLYAVSAYGYFAGAGWAFPLAVIANVLTLQGSWFVNVPAMRGGLPPVYFVIFFPNLVLYFLSKFVGPLSWSRTLLALFAGISFVLCFMNGVASTSRMLTVGASIFVLVQRLNWAASVAWGVVTVGILLCPREWVRVTGLAAGLLEVVVGAPLAIITAIQLAKFSMFSLAPALSLALVVVLALPTLWQRLVGSCEARSAARTVGVTT
jgi:hypothetical protein